MQNPWGVWGCCPELVGAQGRHAPSLGFRPPEQSSEESTPSFQASCAEINQTGRKGLLPGVN